MSILGQTSLLLTATVRPDSAFSQTHANVADPQQRQDQYVAALRYYLQQHPGFGHYVLAENSDADLEAIRHAVADLPAADRLHTLALPNHPGNAAFGKGYGESMLIRDALAASDQLAHAPHVVKVTGRLRIANLSAIAENRGRPYRLLCDLRDHQVYRRLGLSWSGQHCETRMVGFAPALYQQHLAHLTDAWTDGEYSIEGRWYNVAKQLEDQPQIYLRFCREPHYIGVGGRGGKAYGQGVDRVKRLARATGRRLVPGFRF